MRTCNGSLFAASPPAVLVVNALFLLVAAPTIAACVHARRFVNQQVAWPTGCAPQPERSIQQQHPRRLLPWKLQVGHGLNNAILGRLLSRIDYFATPELLDLLG